MNLYWIDYAILGIYVLFVIGIGFALKRSMKNSSDFFTSGRAIPAWITGLAFMSANLGALELVGMAGSGAKYGIATSHFYWVGAIPAMVFLGVFMMPFLLWFKGPQRARVFETVFRRSRPLFELDYVRSDDRFCFRHFDGRVSQAFE